jgi:hypothetical protein
LTKEKERKEREKRKKKENKERKKKFKKGKNDWEKLEREGEGMDPPFLQVVSYYCNYIKGTVANHSNTSLGGKIRIRTHLFWSKNY